MVLNVDTIERIEGKMVIGWDEKAKDHVLECSPVLGERALWTRVPGTPERIQGAGSVEVDTKNGSQFYTLRKLNP